MAPIIDYLNVAFRARNIEVNEDSIHDGVYDISDMPFLHFKEGELVEDIEELEPSKENFDLIIADSPARWGTWEQLEKNWGSWEIFRRKVRERSWKRIFSVEDIEKIVNEIAAHSKDDKVYIAGSYGRYDFFLLPCVPPTVKQVIGDGFEGHGTSAVIVMDKPATKILVLGQND
jgi:hypothetical protein